MEAIYLDTAFQYNFCYICAALMRESDVVSVPQCENINNSVRINNKAEETINKWL